MLIMIGEKIENRHKTMCRSTCAVNMVPLRIEHLGVELGGDDEMKIRN